MASDAIDLKQQQKQHPSISSPSISNNTINTSSSSPSSSLSSSAAIASTVVTTNSGSCSSNNNNTKNHQTSTSLNNSAINRNNTNDKMIPDPATFEELTTQFHTIHVNDTRFEIIKRYENLRIVGSGAQGVVW